MSEAAERHHLARVPVFFKKGVEIVLGAPRFGENQRLAGRAHAPLLRKSDVERSQQRLGLGVGADGAGHLSERRELVDFRPEPHGVKDGGRGVGLVFIR